MILYVCSGETDYLQDLTYAGLAETLGKDHVLDFPSRWAYHKEKKHFWNCRNEYPHNLGYVLGVGPVKPHDIQLIVLGSVKPDALESFAEMLEKIRAPWVFLDGGDWAEIGGDFKRTGGQAAFDQFQGLCKKVPPSLIFKRELALGSQDDKIVSFPFSFKKSLIIEGLGEKKHDVLFWAVESSQTRKKAFQILKGKYDCEANGSVPDQKFRKYALKGRKYFEALAQAKISLSFRGEGFDTLRYWEIPACGSLMISETPSIQILENFIDGKSAVFVRPDLSDLTDKIDYFLAHDKEREEIAAAGKKHLLAHHTHLKRAEYFIEKVKEKLKLDLKR